MTFVHDFVNPPKLVKVTGEDGSRYYTTPEGNRYESVTTYLGRLFKKPHLHRWRAKLGAKEADKVTRAAAARGTTLHKAAEKYLMNETFELDPIAQSLFSKVKSHIDCLNNIHLLETALYSDELKLAGTPDCIAEWCDPAWEAELSVIDFKSKTKIYPKIFYAEHWLQTAIYGIMYKEHFGKMPKWSILILGCPTEPNGIVYKVPMTYCLELLRIFRTDGAEAFEARLEEAKKLTFKKP